MAENEIKSILARVTKWPKAAQEELIQVAREIEEDLIDDPHLMHELEAAHQEAISADGSSLEDIKERLSL